MRLVPQRLTTRDLSYSRPLSPDVGGASSGMDADEVVRVLDLLDRSQITVWLDGGWGVDALLGRQTRPHDDLDLVIPRPDCKGAEAVLAELGFTHDPGVEPACPRAWCCARRVGGASTCIRS